MNTSWRAKSDAKLATRRIKQYGSLTSVNGADPVRAAWTEAGTARVQLFLDENLWKTPAFDVHFPADAIGQLVNGAEVKRVKDGWRGTIRVPENHAIVELNGACTVLVVMSPT